MHEEIHISSWNELNDALYHDAWQPSLSRFRSPYAFRGLNRCGDGLETSLQRLVANAVQMEGHLLRNFRKYAGQDVVARDTIWHWLALAQHHGLPTRLFDWSYSPFVALHFATSKLINYDKDGAVWCINYREVKRFLPTQLQTALDCEGADVFTAEILFDVAPQLSALPKSEADYLVFFEPPAISARIVNQFALFSFMSNPEQSLEHWLNQHPKLIRKIIIPAGLKREIRDRLDQANITERVLLPGLDGLSAWLTRYYQPLS